MEENEKTWVDDLKEEIDTNIKPNNHKREITGAKLNTTLKDMVDEISENIPQSLGDLEGDSTHQTVTEKEKEDWSSGAAIFTEAQEFSDAQRNQALANVSNQSADSNTSKMGYVVLQPEKEGDVTTTFAAQIANKPNTIFEIRDVFDLGGTQETPVSITLPSNSILKFNGGIIKNGTLNGANSSIDAGNVKIFDNVEFSGTFDGMMNAMWIGAKQHDNTFDNSLVLQKFFDDYKGIFKTIRFPRGTYYFLSPTNLPNQGSVARYVKVDGDNSTFITLIDDDSEGNGKTFITINEESFSLESVLISNGKKTNSLNISKTRAILCGRHSDSFAFENVSIRYFDVAIHLHDVWYGGFRGRIELVQNRIGVFGTTQEHNEINTIDFTNVQISGCDTTAANALYPQESGESEADWSMRKAVCGVDFHCTTAGCKFTGMIVEQCDFGIRFNYKERSINGGDGGTLNIINCYFEGNRTYDIYVGDGYIIRTNLEGTLHFSYNINIAQCTLHGDKNIYLKDCRGLIIGNSTGINLTVFREWLNVCLIHDNSVTKVSQYSNDSIRLISLTNDINNKGTLSKTIQSLDSGITSTLPFNNINFGTGLNVNNSKSRRIPFIGSLTRMPIIHDAHLIKSSDINLYAGVSSIVPKSLIKSGNGRVEVSLSNLYGDVINSASTDNDGIEIEDFISRWNNGTVYTGRVKQIFNDVVTTDPTNGLVYNSDNVVIGFGKVAIDNAYDFGSNKVLINIDTLCKVITHYIGNNCRVYSDLVLNSRDYSELMIIGNSSTEAAKARFICTTAQRDGVYLKKHINTIIYNTDAHQYQIYTGTEWVELTDPWTRYYYNEYGKSISERATCADVSGQTYFNYATGIKYTFYVDSSYGWHWLTSIGKVTSLEHPNGYDVTTNPLTYATELTVGEQVVCDGTLYKWNGSGFDAVAMKTSIVESSNTAESITLGDNTIYNCDELTTLDLTLPSSIDVDFVSQINFTSGTTATVLTDDGDINWVGDDVANGAFTPVASKRYVLMFYNDGVDMRCIVSGTTPLT